MGKLAKCRLWLTLEALMDEILAMTATAGTQTEIKVVGSASGDGALVNYVTSQRNRPKTYSNKLYVWETTSAAIPWAAAPVGNAAVATDAPVSTQMLDFAFQVGTGYVVGYAVGDSPTATCAQVYIPSTGVNDPSTYVTSELGLKINYFGNNICQVRFDGLADYSPSTNGNWVGIWRSDHVPYSGAPMAKADVTSGNSSGLATIQGVQIVIGSTYSVGYFMAADPAGRTALAASATFST